MLPAQLVEWNRTEAEYPRTSTIAGLFAAQAARTPYAIALVFHGRALSYRELDERSNQLARRLQALGAAPGQLIGVAMERSEWLVAGLLAVLKSGSAYVPLDPAYPRERLALAIADAQMPVLITTASARAQLPPATGCAILDIEDASLAHESSAPVASAVTSSDLAYVIYTSGSTGTPKGVMVEQRNVVNFFTGMDRVLGPGPGVWLAVTSAAFDISVLELLWTLTRGFTVVVHGGEGPVAIAQEIAHHGVTHLQMTPSLARMLTLDEHAYAALGALQHLLLGGEALPAALAAHLRRVFHGKMLNMYGPTETTIWSTCCQIEESGATVSIGRPIANTRIYILDQEFQPVPIGDTGELYIGGEGVARGYWRRPELTAERFLTLPDLEPGRLYRTGDLARFLPGGMIEFLGRADDQIKLRGHRIEPGEIEARLEKSPAVRQAVVVLREDREGDARLVAYLAATQTDAATLRATLAAALPGYMVPAAFVFLDALPLTSNGKIDRKALLRLPPPEWAPSLPAQETAPFSEMEQTVARVLRLALHLPNAGLTDNFFDLGAHSLTIAEAHAMLQQEMGREFPLLDLFQYTSIRALAAHLGGKGQNAAASRLSERAARRRMARQKEAAAK
jgi:amino acid adenylation domain-containing protein